MTSKEIKEALSRDPSTSYWLEEAIRKADQRDVVDMMRDCQTLQAYLAAKMDEIKKEVGKMRKVKNQPPDLTAGEF